MGTRNLTIVKIDGQTKVAQYGQWDGYPTGQGKTIAKFFDNHGDLDFFKEKVRALKRITAKELDASWVNCGAEPEACSVSMGVSYKHSVRYPELSRDTGAGVLKVIQDKPAGLKIEVCKLGKNIGRAMNTYDAEYAYEIDLDEETVTVWAYGKKYGVYKFSNFNLYDMEHLDKEINGHLENETWPEKPMTKINEQFTEAEIEIDLIEFPKTYRKDVYALNRAIKGAVDSYKSEIIDLALKRIRESKKSKKSLMY